MPRSVPLSVRISDDDAAFLAQYKAEGAKTPSEKLRAILSDAKRIKANPGDYVGCVEVVSSMLRSSLNRVRKMQREDKIRSEFVARLYERSPELIANLMIGPDVTNETAQALHDFEDELAQQVFALIEEVLDFGLTKTSRTYDPLLVKTRLEPILEILGLIQLSKLNEGDIST